MARSITLGPMTSQGLKRVVIAGGSGFLGSELRHHLAPRCEEIVVLTRGHERMDGATHYVHWDGQTVDSWAQWLNGADAIVNLVGRTVDCRKTPTNKKVILESRVNSVRALAAGWRSAANPPRAWIQSATAHIYGDTGDEILDESSSFGLGFAPMVGQAWEAALNDAELPAVRKVILRISFVLGRSAGPLRTLAGLARLGLGGTIGSGQHYMSWIHVADLNAVISRALTDPSMHGPYVVTSPGPVTNEQFMRDLRRAVHRPWSPPVPSLMVHLGAWMMRTDPELALLGRRLMPTRLTREGFAFSFPELRSALDDLL